jgi:23S rRNA (cytidine1920-2'-O)/16S rRNA (cytidine1409-2'-O)-methyltransferase
MPKPDQKSPKMRERLDALLVEKGFAKSRERAKSMILSGSVLVNGQKIDKAGTTVKKDSEIRILEKDHEYVGRGALKILDAIEHFKIDLAGLKAIDAGASTGGFTEVMLKKGAVKVYAVDVGYGILDWKLKKDSRIIALEKTNVRYLTPDQIKEKVDFITADLSFISLKKVIPVLVNFLKESGSLLALIKPQFEVGKAEVEKGGLVKDPAKHQRVIKEISDFCIDDVGLNVIGIIESKVRGTKGNKEFFIYCRFA